MQTDGTQRAIALGADVISKGQEKVGSVSSVVVRSPNLHVSEIVVNTGALLGRNIVVPGAAVRDVSEGKVYLAVSEDQLEQYPDYVSGNYLPEPAPQEAPTLVYGSDGRLSPMDTYRAHTPGERVRTPSGTVAFKKGMEVESSDRQRVGAVEAVDTDPGSGDVTSLLVKDGLLSNHKTWIPVGDVAVLDDNKVKLTLTKAQVQDLEREQGVP